MNVDSVAVSGEATMSRQRSSRFGNDSGGLCSLCGMLRPFFRRLLLGRMLCRKGWVKATCASGTNDSVKSYGCYTPTDGGEDVPVAVRL